MAKFKTGDRLRCINPARGAGWMKDGCFTVENITYGADQNIENDVIYWPRANLDKGFTSHQGIYGNSVELVTDTKGDNNMSVSPQEIRNLSRSEDDQILCEHEYMSTSGIPTQNGIDIVLQKTFDKLKADIVADIKKAEAKKDLHIAVDCKDTK
jgi:hypothetical protein